jgi:protein-S-isoprenylcysteine O-methyltransferase Ste14
MSLIPEFELGLWNAWIFWFYFVLQSVPMTLIYRYVWKDDWKKAMGRQYTDISPNKTEKRLRYIVYPVMIALIIYSIFLPLKLGTVWFYVGLPIYLLGVIFGIMADLSFATTPLDKPVTKGAYHISRNPMDFSAFLIMIGTGIACASWLYLLFAMIWIIVGNRGAIAEERFCLEKYGDAYREYMSRTPRWIGIPRSGINKRED